MTSPRGRAAAAAFVTLAIAAVALTVAILCEYLLSVPIVDLLERLRVLAPDWRQGHDAAVALWCVAIALPPGLYFSILFYRHARRVEDNVAQGRM